MRSPVRRINLGKAFDKLPLVKLEIRVTHRRHAQGRDMTKTGTEEKHN